MPTSHNVLWLSVSPSLKHLDRPILQYLSQTAHVSRWEYLQTRDEASSLEKAVVLLHDYLKCQSRPIHLVGHGIGGVLGLIYARRYPSRVQSLTLLAVAVQPAATWHAHYYVQRQLLPCSRQQVLANTVRSLFGDQPPYPTKHLVAALGRDLEEAPCMHSLFRLMSLPKGGVDMPLMVCGSKNDPVVDASALDEWMNWLKPEDLLWDCPEGRHFFHYFYPEQVGEQILEFWRQFDRPLHTLNAPTSIKKSPARGT